MGRPLLPLQRLSAAVSKVDDAVGSSLDWPLRHLRALEMSRLGNAMTRLYSEIHERTTPILEQWTRYGPIRFYCPTGFCVWRTQTLLTKEPQTIAWIDAMEHGAILWDIGANVGCYSLYAAKRGLRVIAFEPSAANYAVLIRNIRLNQMQLPIDAYCIALGAWSGDATL